MDTTHLGHKARREPPRRPMAAGHVIIVALVALGVGSLLNAKGMLKTANGQNLDSTRRGLALAFARPLDDVSHFLHTDRPRAALQSALGRRGDDDIASLKGPSPTTTTTTTLNPGQATPPSGAPAKPVFSESDPLRMYVGGDSLSVVPGQSLITEADKTGAITAVSPVDGRVSTGLARPDVFDWPGHIAQLDKALNPRAVVLSFGANDDQSLQSPDGSRHGFGSEGWRTEYRRRVGGLMDQILSEGRNVFWIGIPVVRDEARSERYALLNEVYQSEAAARPGRAFYLDTPKLFFDANGHYADYLPDSSGQLVKMRASDGIHFERAGGNRIAASVLAQFREMYDFRR
jgi:uncharacterized protein